MTRKQEIRIHIIFWVVLLAMNELFLVFVLEKSFLFSNRSTTWTVLQTLAFSLLEILIFYLNYSWICPQTIPRKKWKLFAFGLIGLLFLFPAIRYLAEEIVIFNITGQHNYYENSRTLIYYVYDNSYYAIRIILLSTVFYFIKYLWNTNKQMGRLQLEKKQAELQVLKNQLSPHFLFNTLNSFYSQLFDTQPDVAKDILKLSEMLRYVTYDNENDTILLKDEIEFLQNYIDLFKRRFDTIPVRFDFPKGENTQKIPSLLLVHFVENAFKHGILDDDLKPIDIHLKTEGNQLTFKVSNYFRKNEEHYDVSGIGHKNVRQRLEILFPENHNLNIEIKDDIYQTTLIIPFL